MVTILLEKILTLLTGWVDAFTEHATNVLAKLNLIEEDTSNLSDIKDNTANTASNTASVITPINNISSNTSSIKTNTDSIKADTTIIKNNINTISTNTGSTSAYCQDIATNTLDIKDKVVTIASDTTQIRTNTDNVLTDLDKVYEALKWSLVDKITTETVEGTNAVSFNTDLTNDLVELEVGIEATQSGSGEPSLINNRPFIGYSIINLLINGVQTAVSLGDTYYEALVDLINGKIIETKTAYNFTGTENWILFTGANPFWYITLPRAFKGSVISSNGITSQLAGTSILRVYFQDNIDANTDMHTIFYSGTQIYAELNTPAETTITPSQIPTIIGDNTIVTDGDIKATYEESIKHYLDKQ